MKKKNLKNLDLNITQSRVLDYILEHGSITSLDAFKKIGETRLSARVYELRDKGVPINAEYISVKNRFGETRHVKKYFLA